MKHFFFFLLLLIALFSSVSQAAPVAKKSPLKPDTDVETKITANKLTYQAEKRMVVFDGDVHVIRPDFDLRSMKLTVYLKPAEAAKTGAIPTSGIATGNVDRLEAQGKVIMKEPEGRTGTCEKAIYTVTDGVLFMEGNPRLSDGENTVTGETIRYFTQENRSEVNGGSKKRVEAVFSNKKK